MHRLRHRRQFLVGNHWSPYRLGLSLWNDANRATLSDAAVEFAAADTALLKTASDPAFFTLAGKTVSIWVKLDDSAPRLIFKQQDNRLYYANDANKFVFEYNDGEAEYTTADGTDVSDWVNIVIIGQSSGVKIYINSILDTAENPNVLPVTGANGNLYQFGGERDGVWFDGKFDSSAIWNREFTDAEVLQLYNDGDGFTYSQLPANLATGILHAWDFSARSATGVWFDAVGGANLTEEFGDIIGPTTLNGGFEDGSGNEFTGWTKGETGSSTITEETTDVFAGDRAVSINVVNGDNARLVKVDALIIGHTYYLEFRAKRTSGSEANLRVETLTGGQSSPTFSITDEWAKYTWEFKAEGPEVRFQRRTFSATYAFAIDNVILTATSIPLTTGITAGLAKAYGTDVGDSVSLWLDRSSEGNDLAQTAIVSQPMLVEVDGNKWIKFDGVSDTLRKASLPLLKNVSGATLVVVVQPDKVSGNNDVITVTANAPTSARAGIRIANGLWAMIGRRLDADSLQTKTGGTATIGVKYVVVARFDYASANVKLRVNGSNVIDQTFQTAGNTSDTNSATVNVSGISSLQYFQGLIGQALITERAIADSEAIRIERSLAAKYGITLAS